MLMRGTIGCGRVGIGGRIGNGVDGLGVVGIVGCDNVLWLLAPSLVRHCNSSFHFLIAL